MNCSMIINIHPRNWGGGETTLEKGEYFLSKIHISISRYFGFSIIGEWASPHSPVSTTALQCYKVKHVFYVIRIKIQHIKQYEKNSFYLCSWQILEPSPENEEAIMFISICLSSYSLCTLCFAEYPFWWADFSSNMKSFRIKSIEIG